MLKRCKEMVEPYLGGAHDMLFGDLPEGGERDGWGKFWPAERGNAGEHHRKSGLSLRDGRHPLRFLTVARPLQTASSMA